MTNLKPHLGSLVRGLTLGLVLGCTVKEPFMPQDDYATYSAYRQDIALYNLQGILKESCGEYAVSPGGIYCEVRHCLRWVNGVDRDPYTGTMRTSNYCGDWDKFETRIGWEEIGEVEVSDYCVHVKNISGDAHLGGSVWGCTFWASSKENSEQLKKAIDEYLGR